MVETVLAVLLVGLLLAVVVQVVVTVPVLLRGSPDAPAEQPVVAPERSVAGDGPTAPLGAAPGPSVLVVLVLLVLAITTRSRR